MKKPLRLFLISSLSILLLGLLGLGVLVYLIEKNLPDVAVLNEVQLQTPLRVYTNDGVLLAEYGQKRRIPVPYHEIPNHLIEAVLSTEDQRFFDHPGVDVWGLMRASLRVIATRSKSQGGSTITMQVARNFFLSRKKTYSRKLREILLAIKIDKELSKEKILNLYLNKIYLGNRAYGVGAASQVYYGKPLSELTLAQMAMIAGLPKAPSALNPIRNPQAAEKRRNHVLARMHDQGYIDDVTYQQAVAEPITASFHGQPIGLRAPYVAEMIRSTLVEHYGDEAYTMGLNVYATIDSLLQRKANQALRKAILEYEQRHGYRGPRYNWGEPKLNRLTKWTDKLKEIPEVNGLQAGAVLAINEDETQVILANGKVISIPFANMQWARKKRRGRALGPNPSHPHDVLSLGDVIYVEYRQNGWHLSQKPDVEGALVALDPQHGGIKALVGGFDYDASQFNRALQAKRQPGSSFKPFIYAAALANGFTLAHTINDAPIVIDDPSAEQKWRPQNDTRRFYGPTRLRVGLTKSRNLVSIRLLDAVGIDVTLDYIKRFGFNINEMPNTLSLALGSGDVTPLEMATGYAVFANGGYRVTPHVIDYISNSKGEVVYQSKAKRACDNCNATDNDAEAATHTYAPRVLEPRVAYLMTSVLRDVIQHGTGRRVRLWGLKRDDLAGKTGTTNDQIDAWFAGFNSDIVTIAWVGYDKPRSLYEYGSKAALPMWVDFMKVALHDRPEHTMNQPPGLISVRINPATGQQARAGQYNTIFELFREENVPQLENIATNANLNNDVDDDDEDITHLF